MSKRKWYTRALYTVFALALVVGLTLVPATPVMATDMPSEGADCIGITDATGTTLESIPATGTIYIWVHDKDKDTWNKDPFSPESVTVTLTIKRGGVDTTVATKTYSAMEKGNDEEDFRTAAISVGGLGVEPGYRLIPSLTNATVKDSPYYIQAQVEFVEVGPYDIDGTMTLRVKDDSLNDNAGSIDDLNEAVVTTLTINGQSLTKANFKETGKNTGIFEWETTPNDAPDTIWCGDAMEFIYKNDKTTLGATNDQLKDTAYVYATSPSSVSFDPGIVASTASSVDVVVIDRDESPTSAADSDKISGALVVDSLAADDSVIDSLIVPGDLTEGSEAGKFAVTVSLGTGTDELDITDAAKLQATYTDPNDPDDTSTATATVGTPVSLYDDEGELVDSYTTIAAALTAASADYTIEVGPGTYTPASTLTISDAGLTLVSTDGAEATTITSTAKPAIGITADDVTFDGFTVDGAPKVGIEVYSCDGVLVQNNVVTDSGGIAISLGGTVTDITVSSNTIEDCWIGIFFSNYAQDCTVSDNTITGTKKTTEGGIVFGAPGVTGNTVSENTITGGDGSGIYFWYGACEDNLIEGNTISGNAKHGIEIDSTATVTDLTITGNDITDNEEVGILVESWDPTNAIKFNNITGNEDYGVETSEDIDATHNWWGTKVSSEVADMITGAGTTTYEPCLGASIVLGAAAFDYNQTSLDAKTEVGVKVSGVVNTGTAEIGAALYTANPKATPAFTVLENGFLDVYVVPDTIDSTDEVILKFSPAGIDDDSVVYAWNELYGEWEECTLQDYSSYGGYTWVKVCSELADVVTVPTIEALAGLPFAISGEAPPPPPGKGDFDADNDIDLADFVQFATAYDSVSTDPNYNVIGDFDDDGDIDLADFVQFASVYDTSW